MRRSRYEARRMTLTVSGLGIGRTGRLLLRDVAFELAPGTALSVRGKNGLGKTTLLRTLAGLQPPLEGTLSHDPDAVAYAAHSDALKATLTVEETLRFWAQIYATDNAAAGIAAYGLDHLRARPGGELSAGQRRRCALARLVVSGRSIWLMDEPTAALDADGKSQLAAVLRTHLGQGGSAMMVNHGEHPIECTQLDLGVFEAAPEAARLDAFGEAVE